MKSPIGVLDQRVTLMTPIYSTSTQSGQGVANWEALATVWASVTPLSSGESLQSSAVAAQTVYEIEVRSRVDVTPKMRVQWTPYTATTRTFEIHGIKLGGRTEDRMVLVCGEMS